MPVFAIIEFETPPLRYADVPGLLLSWLQDAGGFAAVGLAFWMAYVAFAPRPTVVGGRQRLISPVMAICAGLALVGYLVALGMVLYYPAYLPETPIPPAGGFKGPPPKPPISLLNYVLAASGFCAFIGFAEPFFADLIRMRWGRVYALAKLSFTEAMRRRVVWVFLVFLLVFLFPATWFFRIKPEDVLRNIVSVTYTAMTPLLILAGLLLAAFSIPADVKNQTIHTIVTKPIERFEIVLGRFLGYMALLTIALFSLCLVSLLLIATSDIDPAARAESMKARSPTYGELDFRRRSGRFEGTDVGIEYTYRMFVAGNSTQRAVWNFVDLPSVRSDEKTFRCEFAFDVYRTLKNDEYRGILVSLDFTTWKWNPAREADYVSAVRAAVGNYPPPAIREDDPDAAAKTEKLNQVAETFGRFEKVNLAITNYRVYSVPVPTGLLVNARTGTPDADPAFATKQGQGRIQVQARCNSHGQFIGVAPFDLFLLSSDGSFSLNFLKGALGLWCRLAIVVGLAIVASTYLTGVISFLASLFLFITGSFLEFIRSLSDGQNVGGGPLEAFTRLIRSETTAVELDRTPTVQLLLQGDAAFRWILRRVMNVIPDTDSYAWSEFVAQGFDVSGQMILIHGLLLTGYLLPWFVLAYYLMRSREVAA